MAISRLPVVNLAACTYLGLGSDPRVQRAAALALERFGTQAGGARLLAGTTQVHFEFEQRLATFLGATDVLTFSGGYLANLSAIAGLFRKGDLLSPS